MDFNKVLEGVTLSGVSLDGFKDGEIISRCKVCGEPNGICKEITGRKLACKVGCKCSRDRLQQQQFKEQLEERKFIINKYFGEISDNKSYIDCTFKNWDFGKVPKENHAIFYNYAKSFKNNLNHNIGMFVCGSAGNGKTFSSACVVNEIEEQNYIGLIIQLPKLIEKSEMFKSDGLTSSMIYKKLRYADLVVLDDFGIDKKFDKEKIYTIINEIYMSKKPLIITTNLTMEEMKEYHSRIRSRINTMCPIVVSFKDNNLRGEEGKKKKKLFNNLFGKGAN